MGNKNIEAMKIMLAFCTERSYNAVYQWAFYCLLKRNTHDDWTSGASLVDAQPVISSITSRKVVRAKAPSSNGRGLSYVYRSAICQLASINLTLKIRGINSDCSPMEQA
jgi:hypothetical protein